ncbi:pyridine nucleotide-disulfide oxidoreductase [Anaerosporomusa subterranea]|uniref:NADH:ubiquinone reductase (non-electrogenic) n=1 Tax=Anaerosporomusa subterranea TaxID=1794912 RepID=A0A154BWC1_ANASB|nr:NAD(P)/FAD-dependent oxidoreductase [Anaerosporomusa subterranea]KYZ77758.1 pyridine nucleotide-disulfide oxidoreductase [Anaerosporomusa subterranea]
MKHVVIIGAGFGGIRAAKALARSDIQVTVIDKRNYHLFQPLLYQVSTAGLSVDDIAYPIRAIVKGLKNVQFNMDEVIDIDLNTRRVIGKNGITNYDFLVVATGGTTNYFGMKRVEEYSYGLKTLDEAVNIRNHILRKFEEASFEDNPDKQRALLTFVVVGGGPTGVEAVGALSELIHHVMAKEYRNIDFKQVRVVLVEATNKLLAAMPNDLSEATVYTLTKKNVQVRLGVQVADFDGEKLSLKGGEIINTHTVIWAAGVRAGDLINKLNIRQDHLQRAIVNEHLQAPDYPDVFIIGDAAHFEQNGIPLPMVAPVATQQADVAADNILNLISGKPLGQFAFKDVGNMATIGRNAAVLHIGPIKLKGFLAWLFWSLAHIWLLVDFRNRAVVFMKWIWDYLFYERAARIITRQ